MHCKLFYTGGNFVKLDQCKLKSNFLLSLKGSFDCLKNIFSKLLIHGRQSSLATLMRANFQLKQLNFVHNSSLKFSKYPLIYKILFVTVLKLHFLKRNEFDVKLKLISVSAVKYFTILLASLFDKPSLPLTVKSCSTFKLLLSSHP